ncbi:MAG: TonB family protein [Ferruginibacter sp.]
MKTFCLFFSFLCFALCSYAQTTTDTSSVPAPPSIANDDGDRIFDRVEVEASFPGGDDGWRKYLGANIDADTPIRHKAKRGQYPVVIKFIVNKDGVISDVKAETSFGHGMEEEAIRVIKKGPKWLPAMQNGKKVNAYRRQPITFVVE